MPGTAIRIDGKSLTPKAGCYLRLVVSCWVLRCANLLMDQVIQSLGRPSGYVRDVGVASSNLVAPTNLNLCARKHMAFLLIATAIEFQKPNRARDFETLALVVSDWMGNARKKSERVSAGLRERTLAAQYAARIPSPARA